MNLQEYLVDKYVFNQTLPNNVIQIVQAAKYKTDT